MKRFLALAALVLGLAACQTEPEGLDVIVGGEVDTVVSVSLPEATRAGVDSAVGFDLTTLESSDYSLRYILEIYLGENCQRHVLVSDNTSVAFPVRLAPGRDYTFVAWADIVEEKKANGEVKTEDELKADRYYNTQDGLDNISIVDNTWNAMDETRDAFTAKETRTGFSAQAVDLHLKRPFAKLRVVATDREDVVNLGLTPHTTVVKYSQAMPTAFDASTGQPIANSAIENKSHTVTYTTDVYEYKDNEYTLFADYFFVPSTGTAKFEFNVYADAAQTNLIKGTNFNTDIFVEANKLTTIKGDVLTTGGNVSINVENELGVKETYTYITSAAALLKAMNSDGNFVLGHDITVSEADIAAADRLAATRTTSKKTVIDLNGKTITIDNRSTNNQPLVTLDEGNTLVFAGVGNIVMTEESTGSFIDNNNTNGGVVIEQATVTNNSTNQNAKVVDGNAVVNAAANVEEDAVSGVVKPQLEYVLANGGEVTLFDNATSNKTLEIATTNPVVIDLNGKTFTFTYKRGFRINDNANVVIKNGTIVNNVDGGRCIETRAGGINFTLENVTLTATNGASQPFTVGGSGNDITVNINNSTLAAGNGGYGITTFNPVALNINNSTVRGYTALNIKVASSSLGSTGSVINVVGSTLEGVNKHAGETNAYSTIMLEDSNVKINIDSTSTVKAIANDNHQYVLYLGNELVESVISDSHVTIAGTIELEGDDASLVGCSAVQGSIGNNVVKFPATYADALAAKGYIVSEPTDGLVTISSAIAQVGDNMYKTLTEAVAAAKTGDTITVLQNTTLTESLILPAGIIFNGNGKQITGTIYAGGNLTFAGHTKVTAFSASYYDRVITIGEGACLEVTGTGRVTLGYRNTFNITGSIENAKTADKANIQPSLIIPGGISITGGNDAVLNVTNAYVKIGNTSSKNSEANGEFTLNFTNTIAEFTNQLTFAEPKNSLEPTFNLNIKNSVLTTGTKLILAAPGCNTVIDNSNVTMATYFRNSGVAEIKNGSKVTGATIQFGENGGHDGMTTVDASEFTIKASSTGHALDGKGTGSITAENGATVKVDYYQDMTINVDATSTFTGTDRYANRKIYYVSDEMALAPTNPDALNATVVSNVWDKTTGKGVITFDSDLTTIGEKAFQRVTNATPSNWATSITLPESVKTIGDYAFAQCYSLTTINIPDSVTSIGQYAFQSCDAVTSVTIGSGVSTIGSGAFYNCYEIKEIICESTNAPALADEWVFNGVDKAATVYVPAAALDTYKAAQYWNYFTNIVGK